MTAMKVLKCGYLAERLMSVNSFLRRRVTRQDPGGGCRARSEEGYRQSMLSATAEISRRTSCGCTSPMVPMRKVSSSVTLPG